VSASVSILTRARALYASAPSHAPIHEVPEPGCFCVATALAEAVCEEAVVVGGRDHNNVAVSALRMAANTDNLVTYNAEHSTEEMLEVFDRAILIAADSDPENDR
jgi:hypothetical protein